MNNINNFIQSGILESYVLGTTTEAEALEVEQMASAHAEVRAELEAVSLSLETYAQLNAVTPNPTIKPLLMAFIDYSDRMQKGESVSAPPIINEQSKVEDFSAWLNRDEDRKSVV